MEGEFTLGGEDRMSLLVALFILVGAVVVYVVLDTGPRRAHALRMQELRRDEARENRLAAEAILRSNELAQR